MDTTADSGSKLAEFIQRWEREQYAAAVGGLPNREMYKEMMKCKETGSISDTLGEMFLTISRQIVERMNLPEKFKDDAIATGTSHACHHWIRFDPSKTSNALAYMIYVMKSGHTQSIHRDQKYASQITLSV